MKQYKYKINGNLYNVTVNDVEDNIANVDCLLYTSDAADEL